MSAPNLFLRIRLRGRVEANSRSCIEKHKVAPNQKKNGKKQGRTIRTTIKGLLEMEPLVAVSRIQNNSTIILGMRGLGCITLPWRTEGENDDHDGPFPVWAQLAELFRVPVQYSTASLSLSYSGEMRLWWWLRKTNKPLIDDRNPSP